MRMQCDGAFPTLSGELKWRYPLEKQYGFPVVTAHNFLRVLAELGLAPPKQIGDPEPLEKYLAGPNVTDDQRDEARRFAPKSEVVVLEQRDGERFIGFRSVGKDWAGLFVLLPGDLVPVVAEYKHGSGTLSLTPPCGVMAKGDRDMGACARREFQEETGILVSRISSLSTWGVPVSSRQSTLRFYPYVGEIDGEPVVGPSKLDASERLKVVLFPLKEWMSLLVGGLIFDDCAASLTFLALLRLGRLGLS